MRFVVLSCICMFIHSRASADQRRWGWRHSLKPLMLHGGHAYEFGVFKGNSMRNINSIITPEIFWGFDSFEGLPNTLTERIHDWHKGAYRADPRVELSRYYSNFRFIAGYYNNSLKDEIVNKYGMRPASYVDIDCDLYESTITALDFMFRNKLISVGTIIGYDDFWAIPCGNQNVMPLDVGEGRAHLEISKKYLVDFECVNLACSDHWDHMKKNMGTWGALFRVRSIGDTSNSGSNSTIKNLHTCKDIIREKGLHFVKE